MQLKSSQILGVKGQNYDECICILVEEGSKRFENNTCSAASYCVLVADVDRLATRKE
jgi:hypothetical protein